MEEHSGFIHSCFLCVFRVTVSEECVTVAYPLTEEEDDWERTLEVCFTFIETSSALSRDKMDRPIVTQSEECPKVGEA